MIRAGAAAAAITFALAAVPASAADVPSSWRVDGSGVVGGWVTLTAPTRLDLTRSVVTFAGSYAGFVVSSANGDVSTGTLMWRAGADTFSFELGPDSVTLPRGRYRVRLVSDRPASMRIALSGRSPQRHVAVSRDATTKVAVSDETPVAGVPLMSSRQPLTATRRALVTQVLHVAWDTPVGADDLRVCMVPSGAPCTAADTDGAGIVLAPRNVFTEYLVVSGRECDCETAHDAVYYVRGVDHVSRVRTALFEFAL